MVKGQGSTLGPIREIYGGPLTPKEQAPKGNSSTPLSELRHPPRDTIMQALGNDGGSIRSGCEACAGLGCHSSVRGGYAGSLADTKPRVSTALLCCV